nr:immunoglobulin heavy chain junction region [Mus musculus]MBK4185853.1 immunoglobulin heavy chain junction region [Mus musculus]
CARDYDYDGGYAMDYW